MSFETDLAFVKASYPILDLVRECQEGLGYTSGLVRPDSPFDQKTRCPVHSDRSPSAKAYVESNSVYCWVCGKTWDVPGLYAAYHGVPIGEAVRVLLSRLGLASQRVSNDELLEVAKALEPSHDSDAVPTAWLDSIRLWAIDHSAEWDHLDAVVDEVDLAYGLPAKSGVPLARRAVAWAYRVAEARQLPAIPQPPALDPEASFLAGVSSGEGLAIDHDPSRVPPVPVNPRPQEAP